MKTLSQNKTKIIIMIMVILKISKLKGPFFNSSRLSIILAHTSLFMSGPFQDKDGFYLIFTYKKHLNQRSDKPSVVKLAKYRAVFDSSQL
jgi:hypothetical protein